MIAPPVAVKSPVAPPAPTLVTPPPPAPPQPPRKRRVLAPSLGAMVLVAVVAFAMTPAASQPSAIAVHACDRLAQPPRSVLGQSALVDGVAFGAIDVPRARTACEAAVAAYPNEPRFRAWLGLILEAGGFPAGAVAAYRSAAERGLPIAQNSLGAMLLDGRGIARDDAQAVQWFRRAAEQGNADAQHNLGVMLQAGRGIARDDAQAVEWYRRAAEQGNAFGQANLGFMLREGRGIAPDDEQAVEWYRRAAEQGNADAQNALGVMLRDGRGIARNHAQAIAWFRRAADQGHPAAQGNLASLEAPPPPPPPPPETTRFWVFFDFNDTRLSDRGQRILAEAAASALRLNPDVIQIDGHDDTSQTRDRAQTLSQRRADVVANELVRLGLSRHRIRIQAFGKTSPIVPTADGVREPQNRRVEIFLGSQAVAR